jgi:hypothetical protein
MPLSGVSSAELSEMFISPASQKLEKKEQIRKQDTKRNNQLQPS